MTDVEFKMWGLHILTYSDIPCFLLFTEQFKIISEKFEILRARTINTTLIINDKTCFQAKISFKFPFNKSNTTLPQ